MSNSSGKLSLQILLSVYGNLSYDPATLAVLLCISEMQYSLLLNIYCHSYKSRFFLGCLNKKSFFVKYYQEKYKL